MTGTPEEAVRSWLHDQGYRVEHTTASAFKKAGYVASQGWVYKDGASGKFRDIDVIAHPPLISSLSKLETWITCVIECKKPKAPWVVRLSGDRTLEPTPPGPIATRGLFRLLMEQPNILSTALARQGPTAFSVVQTHADAETNPAFAACNQAIAAAVGYLRPDLQMHRLAYPIVVIDAPLFTLAYREDGTEDLVGVEWARLLWSGAHTLGHWTQLDVVTLAGVEAYAERLNRELAVLLDLIDRNRAAIAEEFEGDWDRVGHRVS